MKNKYDNCTSIRLDPAVKGWLYNKMQAENRSLGNLVNTILKREKEREEKELVKMIVAEADKTPLINY